MANLKSGSTVGGFAIVNTLELNKRITAMNTSVNAKANLASPTFTGTPKAPTVASATDNSTNIATTAFVQKAFENRIKFIPQSTTITTSNLPTNGVAFTY